MAPPPPPGVAIGPRLGEDAAVLAATDADLVVTTDPITFVTDDAPRYAVIVNANDIAAMGAEPAWLATTILLPDTMDEAGIEQLFQQLYIACEDAGVALVTGHTEVTTAVTRPIIVGTMIGRVARGGAISSAGARPGDALLLLGHPALEGTAILATDATAELERAGVAPGLLVRARGLLRDPGISVVRSARLVRQLATPHALHDATEGGVATAIRELAEASAVGVEVAAQAIPWLNETDVICSALGLNRFGLLSSGCLVSAIAPDEVGVVQAACRGAGVVCAVAGRFTIGPELLVRTRRRRQPLPEFDRDELARFFDQRVPQGRVR